MGFLDRIDRRNQDTLGSHKRQEKEFVTKGAERVLSWSFWVPLILLLVFIVVIVLSQLL